MKIFVASLVNRTNGTLDFQGIGTTEVQAIGELNATVASHVCEMFEEDGEFCEWLRDHMILPNAKIGERQEFGGNEYELDITEHNL